MSQNATISTSSCFAKLGMCFPFAIPPQPIIPTLTFLSIKSSLKLFFRPQGRALTSKTIINDWVCISRQTGKKIEDLLKFNAFS